MPGGRFLGACRAVVYPTWGRLPRRAKSHPPLCSLLAFRLVMVLRGVRWRCRRMDIRLIRNCGRRLRRSRRGLLWLRGLLLGLCRRLGGLRLFCGPWSFCFPGLSAFRTGAEKMAEHRAGLKARPYEFNSRADLI